MSRVFVLTLDGVPCSLLKELELFRDLWGEGDLVQMDSVLPTLSSVAWTNFQTGRNPGKHGIFGFIDRKLNPFEIYIPLSRDIKSPTIYELISESNLNAISVNIPLTYPPRHIKGIMVSGFLCTDIKKGTYPPDFSEYLLKMGYIIDVDPSLAYTDKDKFLKMIYQAFERRIDLLDYLLEEEWNLLVFHIMETDRIQHFFGKDDLEFLEFFKVLEKKVMEIYKKTPEEVEFIMLSDHGFTEIKYDVNISNWLEERGYLKFKDDRSRGFNALGETVAYSLIPGRVYIAVRSREPFGIVEKENRERIVLELVEQLKEFRAPETEESVFKRVYRKEELYTGEYTDLAPDIILEPSYGYNLVSKLDSEWLFQRPRQKGMHTKDDAFLFLKGHRVAIRPQIEDVTTILLHFLEIDIPKDLDGRNVLKD